MSEAEIDAGLRALGYDPKEVAVHGQVLVKSLLKLAALEAENKALREVVEAAKRWERAYYATDGSYILNDGEAMKSRQGLADALSRLKASK